jgi:ABC-type amino acid transport system permease subunit
LSQIIIVMLGSAVVSQIWAEELTFAANFIQSRNFRAFEAYFIVTAVYLLLAIGLRAALQMVGARLFARR